MKQSGPTQLLLAVDPSLTASGWALFRLDNCQPCALGVISPPGPRVSMTKRLLHLQDTVTEVICGLRMQSGDLLVCEGPAPLVLNPSSALKVERVRGIFESVARAQQLQVLGRINPRTVQTELLGMRGKQLARAEVKTWARQTAERIFGASLDELPLYGARRKGRDLPQDVIDALLIGSVAASRVQLSLTGNIPLDTLFESRRHFQTRGGRRMSGWREKDIRKRSDSA